MLTYNIRLGFCCQLSTQWKQTERKGDEPFKTGGSLHSSSSPNGISLPTWGTLVYRSHVFTSFLHCDYAPKAFSSCLCSSSHWHRRYIFPRVHGHWVHGCWIWPCEDWLWPTECGQCDSVPVLSQHLKRYCVFLHPALCFYHHHKTSTS